MAQLNETTDDYNTRVAKENDDLSRRGSFGGMAAEKLFRGWMDPPPAPRPPAPAQPSIAQPSAPSRPVTDPQTLAMLNSDETPALKPVTDQTLIARLNQKHDVDYSQPDDAVRSQIAKLTPDQHDSAVGEWQRSKVAQDYAKQGGASFPTPRIPIASAIGDHINAAANAGLNAISGGKLGQPYEENLANIRAHTDLDREAHPYLGFGADLVGATVLPMGKVAEGATALARVGTAAGVSGGISASDAALNTPGSVTDKAEAALRHGAIGTVAGAAVGGAAEAVGGWWAKRALAQETGKYFDQASGELTPMGQAAAQQMDVDPAQMVASAKQTFAKTYAANPADAQAMVGAGKLDFDIPQSLGQRTKDPEQLMSEKAMRSGLYGDKAKSVITNLDQDQAAKVAEAARSTIPSRLTPASVPRQFNADVPFDSLGNGNVIQSGLQTARKAADASEDAAWKAVPAMTPSQPALDMLPSHLSDALAKNNTIVDENTAVAASMVKRLGQFVRGESPTQVDPILNGKPIADVDRMRRQLYGMMKSADGEDKRAASSVYGAYNDWIGTVAQQKLLSGDAQGYAKLIAARDVTRNLQGLFSPAEMGRQTPGARILKTVMNSDTPENIVNALFAGPKAGIKNGAVEALQSMKAALTQHTNPQVADETIAALRIAQWSKLVQGNDGELLSPQVQLNNIRSAFQSQGSLLRELYRPQDTSIMGRYAKQLEQITWKDPNPSGTATGLASLAKQFFGKVIDVLGPVGKFAYHYSGVPETYGKIVAQKAVRQATPVVVPPPSAMTAALPITGAVGMASAFDRPTDPRQRRGMGLTQPSR